MTMHEREELLMIVMLAISDEKEAQRMSDAEVEDDKAALFRISAARCRQNTNNAILYVSRTLGMMVES